MLARSLGPICLLRFVTCRDRPRREGDEDSHDGVGGGGGQRVMDKNRVRAWGRGMEVGGRSRMRNKNGFCLRSQMGLGNAWNN